MPITVVEDDQRRRLIATAVGELQFAEIGEFIRTQRVGDRRHWRLLFDVTGATSALSAAELVALADQLKSAKAVEGQREAVAVVAPGDGMFGVMSMYANLCESYGISNIGVFRSREAAEEWLGSPTLDRRAR